MLDYWAIERRAVSRLNRAGYATHAYAWTAWCRAVKARHDYEAAGPPEVQAARAAINRLNQSKETARKINKLLNEQTNK